MAEAAPTVVVEFYGLPRRRAGRTDLRVAARTVQDALRAVVEACPGLDGLCFGKAISSQYLVSLDGKRFVTNLNERLPAGARLLILGADAGG
jgi:hypothetical protein